MKSKFTLRQLLIINIPNILTIVIFSIVKIPFLVGYSTGFIVGDLIDYVRNREDKK